MLGILVALLKANPTLRPLKKEMLKAPCPVCTIVMNSLGWMRRRHREMAGGIEAVI